MHSKLNPYLDNWNSGMSHVPAEVGPLLKHYRLWVWLVVIRGKLYYIGYGCGW